MKKRFAIKKISVILNIIVLIAGSCGQATKRQESQKMQASYEKNKREAELVAEQAKAKRYAEAEVKRMAANIFHFSIEKSTHKGYVVRIGTVGDGFRLFVDVYESELNLFKKEMKNIYDYYKKWSIVAQDNDVKDVVKEIPVQITTIKNFTYLHSQTVFNARCTSKEKYIKGIPSAIIKSIPGNINYSGFNSSDITIDADKPSVGAIFEMRNKKTYCKLRIIFHKKWQADDDVRLYTNNNITISKSVNGYRWVDSGYSYRDWVFCNDEILKFTNVIENLISDRKEKDKKEREIENLFK